MKSPSLRAILKTDVAAFLSLASAILGVLTEFGCYTSATPSVSVEEFRAQRAEILCERLFACCDDREREMLAGEHFEECVARLRTVYAAQQESVEAGRIAYSGEAAASCLVDMEQECSAFGRFVVGTLPTRCGGIFTAQVEAGGECTSQSDCIDGFCSAGVCIARYAEGSECAPAFECARGLSCDFDSTPALCRPLIENGAPCSADNRCASRHCSESGVCADPEPFCDGR